MLPSDSSMHNNQVTFRVQDKANIDQQICDWGSLIDATVSMHLNQHMSKHVNNCTSFGMLEIEEPIDANELICMLMEECNRTHQHYLQIMAKNEEEYSNKQRECEQKIQTCKSDSIKLIESVDLSHKIEKDRLLQRISRMQNELQKKSAKLQQYTNMLSKMQSQMQRYQYQLQDKNAIINSYQTNISELVKESEDLLQHVEKKGNNLLTVFYKQVWIQPNQHQILSKFYQQQQQIALFMSHFCQQYMLPTTAVSSSIQLVDQSPIKQLNQFYQENLHPHQYLQQCKTAFSNIEDKVTKLVNAKRNTASKYQALGQKYAQFLKQTEASMQQCKYRIKDLQSQKQTLMTANEKMSENIKVMEKQMPELLKKLKENSEYHEKFAAEHKDRITKLQIELSSRQSKIDDLERNRNQERDSFCKQIQLLTIQIQSLKQSISTLKNVVKVSQDQPQEPIEATVMQQMIDKTYQIRIQNVRYKDLLDAMTKKQQDLQAELCKKAQNIEQIQNNNNELWDQIEAKQKQQTKLRYSLTLINQLNESLNNEIKVLNAEIGKIKQQNAELFQSVKIMQQDNGIMKQKITQLQKQKQKLNIEKQSIYDKNMLLLQQINKLELSILTFSQQQSEELAKMLSHKQILNLQILGMQCLERLEIQQLEISVLAGIVNKYTSTRDATNVEQKGVQADIQALCTQAAYELGQETLRNHNNQKARNKHSNQSVGKLVTVSKSKQYLCPADKQNTLLPAQDEENLNSLNKTCKIRMSIPQDEETQQDPSKNQLHQVQQLNDIINYMINHLKGYTRNGIRANSWLTAQGQEYLTKIQSSKNIKQKYATFQKVRALMAKNAICRQLIRDYERISSFYFEPLEHQPEPSISMWSSIDKLTDLQETSINKTVLIQQNRRLLTK